MDKQTDFMSRGIFTTFTSALSNEQTSEETTNQEESNSSRILRLLDQSSESVENDLSPSISDIEEALYKINKRIFLKQ